MEIRHTCYQVNGIQLHVAEAGKAEGDILLLLHGFPEFWWGWRHQIPYFAQQGYRVVAPDQRGYNLSSKPRSVEAYKMRQLSDDVIALIKVLGPQKVCLVGHDWGGAVAWAVAMRCPHLVHKLIVLNLPHPQALRQGLRWPRQLLKSWYIGFFQIPLLPEMLLRLNHHALLKRSLIRSSHRGTFSTEELALYQQSWQQAGALPAMLNWYRAALRGSLRMTGRVSTPTLLIWGKQDQFLRHELAPLSLRYCEQGRLEMLADATHWLQHEKANQVNQLIHRFIGQ